MVDFISRHAALAKVEVSRSTRRIGQKHPGNPKKRITGSGMAPVRGEQPGIAAIMPMDVSRVHDAPPGLRHNTSQSTALSRHAEQHALSVSDNDPALAQGVGRTSSAARVATTPGRLMSIKS
jgi:hypothetical protein